MTSTLRFSQWLKERRKALDLTQEDLAERVGCSIWTIRKIETGERKPSRQVVELLADALRVPTEERTAFVTLARTGSGLGEIVARVPHGDLPQSPRTPRTPTNLPVSPTALIGREAEVEKARSRLLADGVRLLTLVGPPGIGKTRLALEIAGELLGEFEDGVFFVPLAPVTDPSLVASTIAQVLGLKEAGNEPIQARLIQHLQHKRMLLLLDNFEQVVSAANLVADLLSTCPQLKVLVTSREGLHLRGERRLSVPPLALPQDGRLPPIEALAGYAAVQLFVERAQAVSSFRLTEENVEAVATICVRLDGLPLAIELVAARSRLLPPKAILSRLIGQGPGSGQGEGAGGRASLHLAAGGARDLPARHQTLRAAIEWSYDLLELAEQKLFARLGVFVGGFTLAAAEAVCNARGDLLLDVLDGVESLLDKSLLGEQRTGDQEGQAEEVGGVGWEPRFTMLQTIHEYALERLEESGEGDSVRRWHAEYFLALSEAAEPELRGPRQREWLERLEVDHANLRSALRWASENAAEEIALRLAGSLHWFWFFRGYLSEGREHLTRALSLGDAIESDESAGAQQAAAKRFEPGYMTARAKALRNAGILAHTQGDFSVARSLFEEGLAINQALEDKPGIATMLSSLSNVALAQGDHARAQSLQEESLAIYRTLRDKWGMATTLNNLGNVLREQGRYDEARAMLEEGLALHRQLAEKSSIALSLNSLGTVISAQGHKAEARALIEESLAIRREQGDKVGTGIVLHNLGSVACDMGDYAAARQFHMESLAVNQELGNKRSIALCLEGLAKVAWLQGQAEEAVRLYGAADVLRETIGSPPSAHMRAGYEVMLAALRSQLGEARFASTWNQAHSVSLEEAVALASGDVVNAPLTILREPQSPPLL
jgi:predicted ATPase/DNA-binding XRE family transcriptional regulator